MPTGQNWMNFIYVNLGFIAQVLVMYYFTALIQIKKNWPEYRCNPMYMPLSDNIQEDFTYCVQNTQINLMGYLLQPITYLISTLNSMGAGFTSDINSLRDMISFIRNFVSSIVENIFGVFMNLIIEFQVIVMGIKDMVGKLVGIMVTLMYMMDGSIKTMNSAWTGPPGQMVHALSCFYPNTDVKLKNGSIVLMRDIQPGSVLENGSKVHAVMKIDNSGEDLYEIPDGVDGQTIYVTGSHFVYDEYACKFVRVSQYRSAKKSNKNKPLWYSSLITTDNKIKIGKHMFWDWEDDCLVENKC
jgi:hypothetical protein